MWTGQLLIPGEVKPTVFGVFLVGRRLFLSRWTLDFALSSLNAGSFCDIATSDNCRPFNAIESDRIMMPSNVTEGIFRNASWSTQTTTKALSCWLKSLSFCMFVNRQLPLPQVRLGARAAPHGIENGQE